MGRDTVVRFDSTEVTMDVTPGVSCGLVPENGLGEGEANLSAVGAGKEGRQ